MTTTRGQHLIGKEIGSCVLEKLLGYGGSSAVFLAQDRASNQQVAVKVFLPRSTMDVQMQKNFYKRFLREAAAASKLDHPNILSIYSYGQHQGLPYIVMPYMPGGTLSEYVRQHGPLSLSEAQYHLEQIASALDYAHEHGCVHCDVKPANILLDDEGHAVLSDFGIARLMQSEDGNAEQSPKSPETLMGTPDYISPEQALGEPLDGRSDVYSLGVTLYFLLTGNPPFKADSSIAMALLHVHEPPPLLGLLRADITPQIDGVVGKALAKWPEQRFQAAGEFSAAFVEAVASAENAVASNSEARRVLASLAPIVRVRPAWKQPNKLSPIRLAAIILLPLLVSSFLAIGIISVIANVHSHTQPVTPTSTATATSSVDILTNDQEEWQTSSTFFFQHGQYHILNTSAQSIALAFYENHLYADFRLSVTTSELRGTGNGADYYGVVFRASADQSRYYLFEVAASDGGQYTFLRYDGQWHTLAVGSAPSLLLNIGQHNVIAIEAKGNSFSFFINGKSIGKSISDPYNSPLTSGEIGLCVEEKNTEVVFSKFSLSQVL